MHVSLALNGSSALERFKHGNVIEICNEIMFDFLPGTATHTHALTTHAVDYTVHFHLVHTTSTALKSVYM